MASNRTFLLGLVLCAAGCEVDSSPLGPVNVSDTGVVVDTDHGTPGDTDTDIVDTDMHDTDVDTDMHDTADTDMGDTGEDTDHDSGGMGPGDTSDTGDTGASGDTGDTGACDTDHPGDTGDTADLSTSSR